MAETTLRSITNNKIWIPMLAPTCSTDTSTPIISSINPVIDPAVNDVLVMPNLKINEKQCKVKDERITVTYSSAYLQELGAIYFAWGSMEVGVRDYAMDQSNIKTVLFSLSQVHMHAIQGARTYEERKGLQQNRTCATACGNKICYFFMFPRPPENRYTARTLLPQEFLSLCATGWGPPLVTTYQGASKE